MPKTTTQILPNLLQQIDIFVHGLSCHFWLGFLCLAEAPFGACVYLIARQNLVINNSISNPCNVVIQSILKAALNNFLNYPQSLLLTGFPGSLPPEELCWSLQNFFQFKYRVLLKIRGLLRVNMLISWCTTAGIWNRSAWTVYTVLPCRVVRSEGALMARTDVV